LSSSIFVVTHVNKGYLIRRNVYIWKGVFFHFLTWWKSYVLKLQRTCPSNHGEEKGILGPTFCVGHVKIHSKKLRKNFFMFSSHFQNFLTQMEINMGSLWQAMGSKILNQCNHILTNVILFYTVARMWQTLGNIFNCWFDIIIANILGGSLVINKEETCNIYYACEVDMMLVLCKH
jgi:hypothetical protein